MTTRAIAKQLLLKKNKKQDDKVGSLSNLLIQPIPGSNKTFISCKGGSKDCYGDELGNSRYVGPSTRVRKMVSVVLFACGACVGTWLPGSAFCFANACDGRVDDDGSSNDLHYGQHFDHFFPARSPRNHCYDVKIGDLPGKFPICHCQLWFGFTNTMDLETGADFCKEARCVYGPDSCTALNSRATFMYVMTSIMAALAILSLIEVIVLFVRLKLKKKLRNNATTTALMFNGLSSIM